MRVAVVGSIFSVVLFALGFVCGVSRSPARVPDLGELMLLQQVRHTKLRLAGDAQNWPLANYELEELEEGFDAIVSNHQTDADSPVSPKDAIPRMVTVPLAELREAVQRRDSGLFANGDVP